MIDGDKAIEYLKNKLINLIEQGVIKATYEESVNTISFYISDIIATNRPLLSLRLSNHHENFNNRKKNGRDLPQGDDNLSIELYKPKKGYRNKVRPNVSLLYSNEKPTPIPFSITTIEYEPWLMYDSDVNLIYQSILNWIKSKNQRAVYIDPLAKTLRHATIKTHQANITPRRYVTQAEKNFYLRYGMGDSRIRKGNLIENKQYNKNRNMKQTFRKTIKLRESELKRMIAESVKRVLMESNINETSSRLLGRAADKAFNDMMRNWNDGKIRTKREAQWKKFSRGSSDKETKEKESICPFVPESELKNMPKDTYVILDGKGRDFYGEFMYRYSGYAGTKEQCAAFVNRYYDKYADWEFLPIIVTLEDYFQHYT